MLTPLINRQSFINTIKEKTSAHCPTDQKCSLCSRLLEIVAEEETPRTDKRGGFRTYAKNKNVKEAKVLENVLK